MKKIAKTLEFFTNKAIYLQSIILLVIRLYMAKVFFYSGLTKIKSWDSTLALFNDDYANVPILPHDIAAVLAASAELSMPIFLVLGLFTPLAGLALFFMTLVIELFVFPGTFENYYWMMLFGTLIAFGGGKISLDNLIISKFFKTSFKF